MLETDIEDSLAAARRMQLSNIPVIQAIGMYSEMEITRNSNAMKQFESITKNDYPGKLITWRRYADKK